MAEAADRDDVGPDVTTTRLLDGKLLIRQPRKGHRAGTDAVLLAASIPSEPGERLADVGAGVGTVGLILALRHRLATVHLVECGTANADLARQNAALNGVADRVVVHTQDVFHAHVQADLGSMSLVVSNPPFYLARQNRVSPSAAKAGAHVLQRSTDLGPLGHGSWLRAMLSLLAPHGCALMIHRPDALPALLAAADGRLGNIAIRPIQAFADRPATRILFGGIVGSRAPLRIEPALVLHRAGGGFSLEGEALHRGDHVAPLLQPKKSRPRGPALRSN